MRASEKDIRNGDLGTGQAQRRGADKAELSATNGSAASFWDESQVLAVIRHAAAIGRSPEEFFNRKWKQARFAQNRGHGSGSLGNI